MSCKLSSFVLACVSVRIFLITDLLCTLSEDIHKSMHMKKSETSETKYHKYTPFVMTCYNGMLPICKNARGRVVSAFWLSDGLKRRHFFPWIVNGRVFIFGLAGMHLCVHIATEIVANFHMTRHVGEPWYARVCPLLLWQPCLQNHQKLSELLWYSWGMPSMMLSHIKYSIYESSTWKLHDLCMHFQLWSFKYTFDHLMWLSLCAANCNSESHQHLMFKLLSNYDPEMQVAYLWEIFSTEMALSCLCTVRSPVFQLQFPVTISSFSMMIFTFCPVGSKSFL